MPKTSLMWAIWEEVCKGAQCRETPKAGRQINPPYAYIYIYFFFFFQKEVCGRELVDLCCDLQAKLLHFLGAWAEP